MICDSCRNYHIGGDGTNDGYYTACKERYYTLATVGSITRQYKQEVMDGKRKHCKGYEKI